MKDWTKIDLGPEGKAGVEARYMDSGVARFVYIGGSDHWLDWLHHITPGAKAREVRWARELYNAILDHEIHVYVIGGHSLGGSIAMILGLMLLGKGVVVRLSTYGGKRAPRDYQMIGENFRHRGDWVPFLPPWRPRYRGTTMIGSWLPPWKAHGPVTYHERMEMDGFR